MEVFRVKVVDLLSSILTWGCLPISLPPPCWPCLPWPSSVSGSFPPLVHYLPASTGIDIIPLPYVRVPLEVCSQNTLPGVFTHLSVDAPVDVHNPSHNFPYFHPWEAFLVGHRVTTLLFCSCGIISVSPPKEVVLWGVGLVHLSDFSGGLVTICIGSSLHRRACQPQFVVIPPKSLHPTDP